MRIAVGLFCVSMILLIGAQALSQEPPMEPDPNETTQQLPEQTATQPTEAEPEASDAGDAEVSILERNMPLDPEQAYVDGDEVIWTEQGAHVRGNAFIRFENMTLEADDVWTDMTEALRAKGNIRLQVDEEITYADELVFNFQTKKGVAYGGAAYGDPWYYQGIEILRVSERESLIKNGILTTSSLKHPHTYFKASRIFVHIGKEIIAKNVVFMIGGVPMLWLPAYRRSLKEKKPAAIIVKVGSDSFQGNWATLIVPLRRTHRIRSVLQFDWASLRGTGQGFETTYNIRDVNLRWVKFAKPEGATAEDLSAIQRRAREINSRLRGDFDPHRIMRLFVPYRITAENIAEAQAEANQVAAALQEGAEFASLVSAHSDDATSSRNQGIVGYMAPGDGILAPKLEQAALALEYGETSDMVEMPNGFYFFRVNDTLETHGNVEKQTQMIYISIQASDEAEEATRELGDELVERAQSGDDFGKLIEEYGDPIPDSALTEPERLMQLDTPPVEAVMPLNQFDWSLRRSLQEMEPGDVADPIELREGLLIVKLVDRAPTPDFATLAREISEDEETKEDGGYVGWTGPGDAPLEIYNASRGLEQGAVSNVVETDDGFYVTKSEGRRNITGELTVFRKDMRSYGRENTFKTGDEWEAQFRHQQDVPLGWKKRGKRLAFWTRADFGSRRFRTDANGTPLGRDRSELRTFGVVTYDSNPTSVGNPAPTFRSRLTIDKTFDFKEGTGTVQKLPEGTFSLNGDIEDVFGFKQLNDVLEDVADVWDDLNVPLLKVPTLDRMSFSFDGTVAHLYRDKFRYANDILEIRRLRGRRARQTEDVSLPTADLGLDLTKATTLSVTSSRVIEFDVRGSGQLVYNREDQKGNQNILRGVVSGNLRATNALARVFDIGFVPGASRLRHSVTSSVTFDWAPSVNDQEDDPDNRNPDTVFLYPFSSSTFLFERKRLSFSFDSTIEVKTKRNKKFRALNFGARTSRDYTERPSVGDRKWEFITARMTVWPLASGNMTATLNADWDPNTYSPTSVVQREPFSLVSFSSSLRYRAGDFQRGWSADFGTQYQRLTSSSNRTVVAGFTWRPSRLFDIDLDTRWDYDRFRLDDPPAWRRNSILNALGIAHLHPYSQQITLRRNLRDWDLRITWRRTGALGSVRKEFTYQINLIADPTVTLGAGFDAVTNRWGLRSLPIGVPPTFSGGSLGRSGF